MNSTRTSLRFSGLDILCRNQPDRFLLAMVSDIDYLGKQDLEAGPAHHFRMNWEGDASHQLEIWIAGDNRPRLLKTVTTLQLSPTEETKDQLSVSTVLTWKEVANHPDGHFLPQLPDDSVEVADLNQHLVHGRSADLIGKPAPQVQLTLLRGLSTQLPVKDRSAVLYFFATWAAPSLHEKKAMLDLVDEFKGDPVDFHAVCVGEPEDTVRTFVESRKTRHNVAVDSEKKVARAYGVTSLPTVVLIDGQGKVVASFVGNDASIRLEIHDRLDQMFHKKHEQ